MINPRQQSGQVGRCDCTCDWREDSADANGNGDWKPFSVCLQLFYRHIHQRQVYRIQGVVMFGERQIQPGILIELRDSDRYPKSDEELESLRNHLW